MILICRDVLWICHFQKWCRRLLSNWRTKYRLVGMPFLRSAFESTAVKSNTWFIHVLSNCYHRETCLFKENNFNMTTRHDRNNRNLLSNLTLSQSWSRYHASYRWRWFVVFIWSNTDCYSCRLELVLLCYWFVFSCNPAATMSKATHLIWKQPV